MTREQVQEMIGKLASAQGVQYNWEESIVDLMKLLKLDSSLGARKQLAQELGYTGALDGSAEMNIWLGRLNNQVQHLSGRVLQWEPTMSI
jgi:hypothetical protein